MLSITTFPRRHLGSCQLAAPTALSSTVRPHVRCDVGPPDDPSVCCSSCVVSESVGRLHTTGKLLLRLANSSNCLWAPTARHFSGLYLFASDHLFSFSILVQPRSNKSSCLPHSYTNATSEDDPVQYSRSVKPDFWLYYSNKVLHCILRQQNSMRQTNVSYLVSLTTRTCKIPEEKKRRQKKNHTIKKEKSHCLVMGLILWIKYMLDVQNFCGCVTFSQNKLNELKSHWASKL